MEFNWTTEVFIILIAGVINCVSSGFLMYGYMKKRERHMFWLTLAFLSETVYIFLEALAYILLSVDLFIYHSWLFILFGYSIFFALDFISRDSVDPIKTSVWTCIIVLGLFLAYRPESFIIMTFPNGERSIATAGIYRSFLPIATVVPAFILFYYMVKVHVHAPQHLRKYSAFCVIGAFLTSIMPIILVATEISLIIPGIYAISFAVGSLMIAFTFFKHPKIFFVLPFKVLRMMTMDLEKGTPLFTHDWTTEGKIADEMLFSGMIKGINLMMEESIHHGEVQEIHFARGVLLLHQSAKYSVVSVLVATKSSHILRRALIGFVEVFCEKFEPELAKPTNESNFQSAFSLIQDWFGFVATQTAEVRGEI
jgi:hypothetical protein